MVSTESALSAPDRDEVIMTLAEMTLFRPAAEREQYARRACNDDDSLFTEVWEIVLEEERMMGFLSDPLLAPHVEERPFAPGDLVLDRFRIIREVGQGGMAVVFEAQDTKIDRRVAVKWPKGRFRQRVPPEVSHAAAVSHPNICKIFDLHTLSVAGDEVDFLTMEFLAGETLARRLERGPIPAFQAARFAEEICSGLAEAHRNLVIHGDLKSSNVILAVRCDGSTRAVITDFGLARRPGGNGLSSAASGGTPDYMAPELWRGDPPTRASDVYALGVILCEIFCGKRPFGPVTAFAKRTGYQPQGVDTRWASVIKRCLDADPTRRYQSGDELLSELVAQPRRRFLLVAGSSGATAGVAALLWKARALRWFHSTPSMAVIPFAEAESTSEAGYLSDGLSENLINGLARVPGIRVVARTSSARFKGKDADPRMAGRALGVSRLVTGTLAEMNGVVRVAVELIDAADGTRLWGAQYNRPVSDLAGLESIIVREIVAKAGVQLTALQWSALETGTYIKPEAYEALLRAKHAMHLYTPESRRKAVEYCQQAVALDPSYPLAFAELARAYRFLGGSALMDPLEVLPKAEAACRRALGLKKDLAEAHAVLADISKDRWQWSLAEYEYDRAIELNPNLATAHQGYGIYLSVRRRFDAAVAEIRRAVELDPLGLPTAIHVAAVFYNARRYDEAERTLQRASELEPSAPTPWTWKAMVRAAVGDYQGALAAYERAFALGDDTPATQCYYAHSLAAYGNREKPLEIARNLTDSKRYVPRSAMAVIYTGLNDRERAFQLLLDACAARDPLLQYLDVEAHYDKLRMDPRFQSIRARVGLL